MASEPWGQSDYANSTYRREMEYLEQYGYYRQGDYMVPPPSQMRSLTGMFDSLVLKHFGWLESEYGLEVTRRDPFIVEFSSAVSRVEVVLDYFLVAVLIGSLEPEVIRRVRVHVLDVVELKDPDALPRSSVSPEEYVRDRCASQERQLATYATLLRTYCDEMLRGDFSLREDLKELRDERMRSRSGATGNP